MRMRPPPYGRNELAPLSDLKIVKEEQQDPRSAAYLAALSTFTSRVIALSEWVPAESAAIRAEGIEAIDKVVRPKGMDSTAQAAKSELRYASLGKSGSAEPAVDKVSTLTHFPASGLLSVA